MGKAGRKPTPADRQAIPVGIERRHLDVVDEILKEDLRDEFRVSRRAVTERAEVDGKTYHLERRVHIPSERRRLLGEMVEFYRKHRAASTVKVFAPCESDDSETRREVDEWAATWEAKLTGMAPAACQVALARNALRRMEQQDPDALIRVLRAMQAQESGGSDDDGSA